VADQASLYDVVGGRTFFEDLVDGFYDRVELDPDLLAVYPSPHDLGPARRRLALFLSEYWGGPPAYTEERGHPRLRMRHFAFEIGPVERDRWLDHMRAAVEDMDPGSEAKRALIDYFERGAEFVRNRE
jgi:hemoglobin